VALARAGCEIVVNFRARSDAAAETVRLVEAQGRRAVLAQSDVARAGEVARLAKELRLGVPVNTVRKSFKSKGLRIRCVCPAWSRRRSWRRCEPGAGGGSSTSRRSPRRSGGVVGPHYAALLAKEEITANVVAPALIETEMVRNNLQARPDLIPVGRFGTPEEVAEAVAMIAVNAYLRGQTINVNGGWYMS
jgi:3-oxoacyl-[acyl-carrier protein] reductase